jgi:hypothetical protein
MHRRQLLALTVGALLSLALSSAAAVERWWGVAVGADFRNFDPMGTVSVETGIWPDNKKFGYQAYLEYADPNCDDSMWTLGGEAVWRYKRLYFGLGLSLSDKRLCGLSGTKWHFSTAAGFRISKHFDIQWRHRSHGADFGIAEDTPNDGVNLIQLRWRTKWTSRN